MAYHGDADFALAFDLQLDETMAASATSTVLTCAICAEKVWANGTVSISGCLHRYCLACMQKHVQFHLLHHPGPPRCPHDGCATVLHPADFNKVVDGKLLRAMEDRLEEAAIAEGDRVYCPDPTCSALMSKLSLAGDSEDTKSRVGCVECGKFFCLDCRKSYGDDHACSEEEKKNPIMSSELKELAKLKSWRRCVKCNHMIELLVGCFHVTCRCGHDFCYNCGASRISKLRSGCSCPQWVEGNIIYD